MRNGTNTNKGFYIWLFDIENTGSILGSEETADSRTFVNVHGIDSGSEGIYLDPVSHQGDWNLCHQCGYANVIYTDNQGSIALAKNPEYHARTKHIDIQDHFVRECVENGSIILQYVPTNEMAADAMTKGLTHDRLHCLGSLMGLHRGDVKKWEC